MIEGVLLLAAPDVRLSGISQNHFSVPGMFNVVVQSPVEVDIAGETVAPSGTHTRSTAIRPLRPANSLGVPPSERLEVRGRGKDEDPIVSITLQEHRPILSRPDPELATFPAGALVSGSLWFIWAFTDPRPAT